MKGVDMLSGTPVIEACCIRSIKRNAMYVEQSGAKPQEDRLLLGWEKY